MTKYEGRISYFSECQEYKVERGGTPLIGRTLFRNKYAQQYFDDLRNRPNLEDYGRMENNRNTFYFQFLNGVTEYYTRREILKISKEG